MIYTRRVDTRESLHASESGGSLSRLWSSKEAGSSEGSMWMKKVVFPCSVSARSCSIISERS